MSNILKIKDWKLKSNKQFKTLLITQPSIINQVQRISDGKIFGLDQCVQTRGIFIANKFNDIQILINKFMPDNIHVDLYFRVSGFEYYDKELDLEVEINNMESMAAFMAEVVTTKLVDLHK